MPVSTYDQKREQKRQPSGRSHPEVSRTQYPAQALQHSLGNQGVHRLLRAGMIQAKPACASGQCVLQPSATPGGEVGIGTLEESAIQAARGGGRALDTKVQRQMESAFGTDFSRVRIHQDPQADTLSHSLGARAFATGSDIFFRSGEYAPGSSSGQRLLAHELTHVLQQGDAAVRGKLIVGQPDDQFEQEADRVAGEVSRTLSSSPSGAAQRQCACGGECEDCRKRPEAAVQRQAIMRDALPHLQRQEDGAPGSMTGDSCVDACEKRFNECIHPPWWQFWRIPDPQECLAQRSHCLRNCPRQ